MKLYNKLIHLIAATIAWCLMPNHFHFMIVTDGKCDTSISQGGIFIDPVTNGFRKLLSSSGSRKHFSYVCTTIFTIF